MVLRQVFYFWLMARRWLLHPYLVDHALSKCSRETRKAIRCNTMYRAGSTILTILFVALSMYFFALPTLEQYEAIWSVHT